ncbi:hypothetical protein, partial [Klebsiella pneumoniae]|uniref:hypothetical protein n=1 Tax=Klebsiella pneumoniae TaxID=573 RepID=UPI00272F6911
MAVMASQGDGPKKPGDDPQKPALEFVASEVIKPTLTTMPATIEFSGPLVAPGTVVVKSKSNGT